MVFSAKIGQNLKLKPCFLTLWLNSALKNELF